MQIQFTNTNPLITTPIRGDRRIQIDRAATVVTLPKTQKVLFIGADPEHAVPLHSKRVNPTHTSVYLEIDDIRRAVAALRDDGIDI